MLNKFSKFVIYFSFAVILCFGPDYFEFYLVKANKVDLNQVEGNDRLIAENEKLFRSNDRIHDHLNGPSNYSGYDGFSLPDNSSFSADQKIISLNAEENENKQLYIDSNGSVSSIKYDSEINSPINETLNNSTENQIKTAQNEQIISEHFDNYKNSNFNDPDNLVSNTIKEANYNHSDISVNEKIRYDTLQAINKSFNVLTVDFSVIYDDLTFEPNLKSNVEYTIFNISNSNLKNRIEREIKTTNENHFVINLEDYSSYGFATWIKPIESNTTEVVLQSNSGIMPIKKIKMLEKFFPRRNFTNDELDIIILSESRNEMRPYGYRGSPMILTQFIENIDLNNENEDIFSFRETIDILNQTNYFKGSNNSIQTLDQINKTSDFELWNNSFLLHESPEILSINCNYYNEWSAWSTCTNECGWGIQTRGRRINANLLGKSFELSDFEVNETLRKCKVQVQTQGCVSKIGCCEYQLPMENLWKNCTASCDKYGTEEQIVDLVSNKKGKVKDPKCEAKKILKRKCVRLSGDICKTCNTTQWSEWTNCSNEDGDFVQKRKRDLIDGDCVNNQTKLEEKRICEKIPLISTSPTANIGKITKAKQKFSSEDLNEKESITEIKECDLLKSEIKYNVIEGACECPNGVDFCDNTVIENYKTSWESHLREICDKEVDVFTDKSIMIMAKGKRLYNCKNKSWDKYISKPGDSDCKHAFVLCNVESNCMVSSWSNWSGCSSPCKSTITNLGTTPILSTRFKTRKVVSGECKEHSLFMKEECLDVKECPQTIYTLSLDKSSIELFDLLFNENVKIHIMNTFAKLQEYNLQNNSNSSNVMKYLFKYVLDIIMRNSEYIYKTNFNFNVFGGDGNYHNQSYINFILSKYKFDNEKLVKDIIVWLSLPSDEEKDKLYEKLSENDKEIIGTNKEETNKFLRTIFPSSQLNNQSKIEENSSLKLENFTTESRKNSTYHNFNLNKKHSSENSESETTIPTYFFDSVKTYKNESSGSIMTDLRQDLKIYQDGFSENSDLEKESDIVSKIINPELLFNLMQIAIIKNTNCRPFEISKQGLTESNNNTKCVCPLGYTLCSSIDYYFGNHISNYNKNGVFELRTPEGVFSDNFVLNQGGLFDQIYEEDKEKYCSKPGAKVMCTSNSELLNSLKYYEIRNLYSRFVRFQSGEESK